MQLCFFQAIDTEQYLPGEDSQASYWNMLPSIGTVTAMGAQRVWEIVGVDSYCDAAHPDSAMHLYHCDIEGRYKRGQWPAVQRNRRKPQTLHLYFGDDCLIYSKVSDEGQQNLNGLMLPQYDPAGEVVYMQTWKAEAIQVMHPASSDNRLSYRAVVLCKCSYVPEASEAILKPLEAT